MRAMMNLNLFNFFFILLIINAVNGAPPTGMPAGPSTSHEEGQSGGPNLIERIKSSVEKLATKIGTLPFLGKKQIENDARKMKEKIAREAAAQQAKRGGGGVIGAEERKGKRILFIARCWYYSHYLIAVNLVNLLHARGYTVHFLHGNSNPGWMRSDLYIPKVADGIVQIHVPMTETQLMHDAIFEEIVWAGGRGHRLWYSLKAESTRFSLAIVDADVPGGLDMVRRLGIAKSAILSVCQLRTMHQHTLGMPLPLTIPAFTHAIRGDGNGHSGIRVPNSQRQAENRETYLHEMHLDRARKLLKNADIRNLKLVLVNQHPLAIFQTPREWPSHVKFIGGIHVEQYLVENKLRRKGRKEFYQNLDCLVLFSFGSMNSLAAKEWEFISAIFRAFSAHPNCAFLVTNFKKKELKKKFARIEEFEQFRTAHQNVHFANGYISQLELLLKQKNLRIIISHCGQNSLNEVIYAGVPIICIPLNFDQFHNAAIVEYLGIGKFVEEQNIGQQLAEALGEMLPLEGNEYREAASRLKTKIFEQEPSQSGVFIGAIDNAIFVEEDQAAAPQRLEEEDGGIVEEEEEPKFIQLPVNPPELK